MRYGYLSHWQTLKAQKSLHKYEYLHCSHTQSMDVDKDYDPTIKPLFTLVTRSWAILEALHKCDIWRIFHERSCIIEFIKQVGERDNLHHMLSRFRDEFDKFSNWEHSDSVVECLTRDRRATGSSLTYLTALCLGARQINPSLVPVHPRKTHPDVHKRLLTGTSRIKSNKQNSIIQEDEC